MIVIYLKVERKLTLIFRGPVRFKIMSLPIGLYNLYFDTQRAKVWENCYSPSLLLHVQVAKKWNTSIKIERKGKHVHYRTIFYSLRWSNELITEVNSVTNTLINWSGIIKLLTLLPTLAHMMSQSIQLTDQLVATWKIREQLFILVADKVLLNCFFHSIEGCN